jgi:hypothetical protein
MSPAKREIEVESRMYRLSALGNLETWIDFFLSGLGLTGFLISQPLRMSATVPVPRTAYRVLLVLVPGTTGRYIYLSSHRRYWIEWRIARMLFTSTVTGTPDYWSTRNTVTCFTVQYSSTLHIEYREYSVLRTWYQVQA